MVHQLFVHALFANIKECLLDTGIFALFACLNPAKLSASSELAMLENFGYINIQELGAHYEMEQTVNQPRSAG